ncbi:MAG: glycosyl transferase group 1 [Acidimicrobiales bacterium]|nr:glycosyl transferase group 1 [Acidimicrobiales bacterium]
MTRVLVLSNMYPPHHLGGYELSCRDVMVRLEARGHEVTVLTTTTRRPGVADPAGGHEARARRQLSWWWDDHRLTSPPPVRRVAAERANQRILTHTLDEVRPDVVSVWNMGAMSLGLVTEVARRGIPLVFAVCDDWLVYGPRLDAFSRMFGDRPRLGRLVERVVGVPARRPQEAWPGAYCFVSDATRRTAEARSGWTFPCSTVVHSGIERTEFAPAATREPWAWRLLYVGRVEPRKGIATLLRAMTLLPDVATLDVVGPVDPTWRPELERLLDELALRHRVRFAEVARQEIGARYAAADALVFPSEWEEPFGLVPVEAMACGTPVVATGTGGSAEFLVDGGNCLRFTPADAPSLAAAVTRLAGDAALRDRLVAGGLATAAELDTDRLADVFEAWHVAAAEGFRHGPPPHRPPPGGEGLGLPGGEQPHP